MGCEQGWCLGGGLVPGVRDVHAVPIVEGCHFYQPDRSAPHANLSDVQTSPDGEDWTFIGWQRVYRSLGELGLYPYLSYDFAPALRRELNRVAVQHEASEPQTAADIRTTIAQMEEPLGRNGIAMTAVHAIQPFSSEVDKQILIRAGIHDFVEASGERPVAFWLPEGAVDTATLRVLAANGIKAFVCAPEQVDADHPRRIELAKGLGIIALPFDSGISRELAFDWDRRTNADAFTDRIIRPIADSRRRNRDPVPIMTFADGETYGMYDPQKETDPNAHGSDRFLEYMLRVALPRNDMEVISVNRLVADIEQERLHAPRGTLNENTAWSCSDGLVRWNGERNCAESDGAEWKRPFYLAHQRLNGAVTEAIRAEMGLSGNDHDDEFIEQITANFNAAFANPGGHASPCELSLASAKVAALAAQASCGTFYADLGVSGWQNIVFARAAVEHLHDAGLHDAARQIWHDYLCTMRQIPAHHLGADTGRHARQTALHLLN